MTDDVVRTKRLELVDNDGHIRALLDTGNRAHVALTFYAKDGAERATVGIMPDGFSLLTLQGENGKEAVKATAGGSSSDSVIVIKDGDEQTRIQAGVSQEGEVALSLTDADGRVRAQVSVDAEGYPNLVVKDGEGNASVSASTEPGATGISIAGASGAGRIGLFALGDGSASVVVTDGEGRARGLLRAEEDGSPALVLLDEEGHATEGLVPGREGGGDSG